MSAEAAAQSAAPSGTTTPPEGSAAREAAEHGGATTAEVAHTEAGERLFGINTESTGLVAAAVAASLLLIVLLLVARGLALPSAALLAIAFTAVAAALDIREAAHQHNTGHPGLTATAIGVAGLHVLAGVAATALLVKGRAKPQSASGELA